jgi:GNAT superfamily N-acetyltransferase
MRPSIDYQPGLGATPRELQALFAHASWAQHRTIEGLETMLRLTGAGVTARSGGALVGFARALTDGAYRALIDDVVVDGTWQGRGIGRELVGRLLEQLSAVEEVRLVCGPELVPFYESLGFRTDAGPLMRRTPDRGSSR